MARVHPNYKVFEDPKTLNVPWKTNRLAIPGGRSHRKDTFQKTLDSLSSMPEELIPKQIIQPSINLRNRSPLTMPDKYALAFLRRKDEHEAKKKYADALTTQNSSGSKPFTIPQLTAVNPQPPGNQGGPDVTGNFRPGAGSAPTVTGTASLTPARTGGPLSSHVDAARIENVNMPEFPNAPLTSPSNRRASDGEIETRMKLLTAPLIPWGKRFVDHFFGGGPRSPQQPQSSPKSPMNISPPSSPARYSNTVAVSSPARTPAVDAILPDAVATPQQAGTGTDVDFESLMTTFNKMQIDDGPASFPMQGVVPGGNARGKVTEDPTHKLLLKRLKKSKGRARMVKGSTSFKGAGGTELMDYEVTAPPSRASAQYMGPGGIPLVNVGQPPRGPGGHSIVGPSSSVPVSRKKSEPVIHSTYQPQKRRGGFSGPGGADILNPVTSAASRLPLGPGGLSIITGAGGQSLGASPRPFRGPGGVSVLQDSPNLATVSPTARRGFMGAGRFDILNPDSNMSDTKPPSPKNKGKGKGKPFRPWESEAGPSTMPAPAAKAPPRGAGGINLVNTSPKGKKPFRPW